MAVLEVKNVKKVYTTRLGGNQVQALRNVSFSVEQGEYVAVMGESGSGKDVIANSLHILSVGSDGIVIEPQTSGVRLNNTEGIVVQSKDKRFTAKMQASDDMSGSSWGFSLYNGEFAQPTVTTSGSYFRVNGITTNIPYFSNYQVRVASNGKWYIYRPTSLKVEDTIDKATRLPVLSNRGGYLYIGGRSTGIPYKEGLDVVAGDNGNWIVGYNSGVTAEYQGQVLVFGVNMNGDAYFNGVIRATDFQNQYGQSILDNDGKINKKYLDLGNIKLDGNTGNISLTGAITIGNYPTCGIYLNGAGNMYMTGNIDLGGSITLSGNVSWKAGNSPIQVLYSRSYLSAPVYPYSSYPYNSASNWHRVFNSYYDKYVSYSYDGGNTWTETVKTVGDDGEPGKQGPQGPPGRDGSEIVWADVLDALQAANGIKSTFITADWAGSPKIYAGEIYGGTIWAGGNTWGGNGSYLKLESYNGLSLYNSAGDRLLRIWTANGNSAALTTGYNELYISAPYVTFGNASTATFQSDVVFKGRVDFSQATVTGLR